MSIEAMKQEPVAFLFTNVQSGDIEASCDPDHKESEREMWYREPLVRPPAAPVQEQWLQAVTDKIEAKLLSHQLSLHDDADRSGTGYPLVDALCCGQKDLEIGKQEIKDIAEMIYHVLATATPPAAQPAPVQEPDHIRDATKMVAAQRQWVGLSDTDLANCDTEELKAAGHWERVLREKNSAQRRIEELEAELTRMQGRELKLQMALNTPAAPVPAIPMHRIADVESAEIDDMRPGRAYREGWNECRAAMLASAQRQWVGLTDEEITDCKRTEKRYLSSQEFARAIEAKLREKNGA